MLMDDEPLRKSNRRLDEMSIEELRDRVAALKAEIADCEAMIEKKEASRKAAEAAFLKS